MNYLLLTFACLSVIVGTIAAELADHHVEIRKKCSAENHLDKVSVNAVYLANPKSNCYLKCFLESNKLINAYGEFDIPAALMLMDPSIREQARPLAEKCDRYNSKIEDLCDKSHAVIDCFFKEAPALFPQLGIFEPPQL
ncbi:uncharacterized protein LOC124413326 [Diprion similis]|uniref:uncharacterized protein LOC124413326 n=1 Tax=Diprion similis TaxID=362088 RepID=UPI001EF935AD|nr:uncharacterized protein LOC124413326 [Diprion similis]